MERTGPRTPLLVAVVALLCVIWSSTWLVIKNGLQDLPPLSSASARFLLAALVMVLVAPWLARREGGTRAPRSLVLAQGICNFALSYGIVYWSETRLDSGLVAVLWGTFPLMMGVAGHLFLPGERLGGMQWLGLLLGFCGVYLLFAFDLAAAPDDLLAGSVLLLSPLVSTLGTVVVKRGGAGVSSALLNRDGLLLGAALLTTAAFVLEPDAPREWTGPALGGIAYLAVLGTVTTFGLYFWVMRYAPAYLMSLIAFVTPGLALILGVTVGEESVSRWTLGGLGMILLGVALVIRGRR